jgi:hypothetical protein
VKSLSERHQELPVKSPKYPVSDPKEEVYVEFDTEFEAWGIFGLNTGFCYLQSYSEDQAKKFAKERNERNEKFRTKN